MDDYTINQEANVLKIGIFGDFTANVAETLQKTLEAYTDRNIASVVFDFQKLTFLASSGLRVLVFAKKRIKEGMEVEIVNAGAAPLKILKMSGLTELFHIVH